MTNQMILKDNLPSTIETAVIIGDLSKLTPEQRVSHYMAVCREALAQMYQDELSY